MYIKYIQKKEKHKNENSHHSPQMQRFSTEYEAKYINISINKYRKIYLLKLYHLLEIIVLLENRYNSNHFPPLHFFLFFFYCFL